MFNSWGDTMKTIVQKFGGSSLATPRLREQVIGHIKRARSEGYWPVVVVSAMGRKGDSYATDTLLELAKNIHSSPDSRNLDLLISCGEVISAVILAETLNKQGIAASVLTGWQSGIQTDEKFFDARILSIHPDRIEKMLRDNRIPVVTGFQGVTKGGDVTTLGRGGSDTTAVALGVVLEADLVEIYTDVDGVKAADPRLVPDAPTLKSITYREVAELAHLGAKVIHPRAVEIAMEQGIPLKVLSTDSSGEGTVIYHGVKEKSDGGERVGDRVVTGIAHLGDRAQVKIRGEHDFNKTGLALKIFDILARKGISVDLIYLSPDLIAFIVDVEKAADAREVLAPLGLNVTVEVGFAKVSVVGAGMHGVPGVMARVVSSLENAKIDIYQTTDSHANISCLVKEEDLPQAVRALYQEFRLNKEGGTNE